MKKNLILTIGIAWIVLSLIGGAVGFGAALQSIARSGQLGAVVSVPMLPPMGWMSFGLGVVGFVLQMFFTFLIVTWVARMLFVNGAWDDGQTFGLPASALTAPLLVEEHSRTHEQADRFIVFPTDALTGLWTWQRPRVPSVQLGGKS